MERAMILYQESLRGNEFLNLLHKVLGPCLTQSLNECIHEELGSFSKLAFFIKAEGYSNNQNITIFLKKYRRQLFHKRVAFILLTPKNTEVNFDDKALKNILFDKDINIEATYYHINYDHSQEEIANFFIKVKRYLLDTENMPRGRLMEEVEKILVSHNTCSLSSGRNQSLRATPIEYTYNSKNGVLYFLSEGGEKFANFYTNPYVAIAIYHEFDGFNNLEGLQIDGTVEMVELYSDEYMENANLRGLSASKLKSLPAQLNMFKVIPNRIQVLKAEFRKEGYHARQILELS